MSAMRVVCVFEICKLGFDTGSGTEFLCSFHLLG